MSSPQSPTLFPFLQLQMHSKYPPPPRRKFVPQLQIVFKVSLPSLIFFTAQFLSFLSHLFFWRSCWRTIRVFVRLRRRDNEQEESKYLSFRS